MGACMPAERVKVTTRQTNLIQFGDDNIELAAVEQLTEKSQTRAIADALNVLRARCAAPNQAGKRSLAQLLAALDADMDAQVDMLMLDTPLASRPQAYLSPALWLHRKRCSARHARS